jgi:DNA-binding MarR family transcriptional regulator
MMEIQPISVARLVDRMEAAGWINRRPDPDDRRVHRLYLSPKAQPVLERALQLAESIRTEAFSGFDEDEKLVLMRLLQRVHGNLCSHARAVSTASQNNERSTGIG